jgi:uncharacterized protein
MFQDWTSLTFLHWRYDPRVIQARLPAGLAVDTYDGTAWVGLTPFLLANLRLPGSPSLPWISHFPETNLRTYVKGPGDHPGIWFFSLEAARLPAVLGARLYYGLPYHWGRMRVAIGNEVIRYTSRRYGAGRSALVRACIQTGAPLNTGELEQFLTARFRLYALMRQRLIFADVEHAPWPLRSGRVLSLEQTLVEHESLPRPLTEPHVLFSDGVRVRIGLPRFV